MDSDRNRILKLMNKEKLKKKIEEEVAKFNRLQRQILLVQGGIIILNDLLKAEDPTPPVEEKKEEEVV